MCCSQGKHTISIFFPVCVHLSMPLLKHSQHVIPFVKCAYIIPTHVGVSSNYY